MQPRTIKTQSPTSPKLLLVSSYTIFYQSSRASLVEIECSKQIIHLLSNYTSYICYFFSHTSASFCLTTFCQNSLLWKILTMVQVPGPLSPSGQFDPLKNVEQCPKHPLWTYPLRMFLESFLPSSPSLATILFIATLLP